MKGRKFEEFLSKGIVKKQTPNKQRALSLIKEAEDNEAFLKISLQVIPSEKMRASFVVNACYDIIMELIRAKIFIDGYNVGNSHEVEISYLRNLGFSEAEVIFMDELRYYRNGTKYYGTQLDKEYADKVLEFMNKIIPRLRKLLPTKEEN
jgi:hypothetical protein